MFPRLFTTPSTIRHGSHQDTALAMHRPVAKLKRLAAVLSFGLALSMFSSTGTGWALPVGPLEPRPERGTPTPTPTPTCFGLTPTIVMKAAGTVFGTAGRDIIVGSAGNDVIHGLGRGSLCSAQAL